MNDNNFDSWVAGFWEGEGCILKRNKNRKQIEFSIDISQVICSGRDVEPTMKKIQKAYGGNIYRQNYSNDKIILRWRIGKRVDVIKFINAIYPYCQIRRQGLEEILTYYRIHPPLKNKFLDLETVKELRAAGVTVKRISKIFNMSSATFYNRLKKLEPILQT